MSLPRYPKYRDSGLDWLGDIPVDWHQPTRFGEISSLKGRLGWQGLKADEYRTEGPYVVSSAHFSDFRIRWEDCPCVSEARYEADINIQLYEGDVLLMKDGAAMGKLAFIDSLPGPACLNSHLLLFRPLTLSGAASYVPKFAFYFMQTGFFQEHIRVNGTGATFLGISQEAISRYRVAWPITEEQEVIVSFLDRETAKIDALVAEQKKLLTLLAEKRQATISHAVTRGLDPNVPMRDSGIPWLGEVPAHWSTPPLRLRYASELGKMLDTAKISGEHLVPYLRNTDVQWGRVNFKDLPEMDISEGEYARYTVLKGDLMVCEGGEVGRAAVLGEVPSVLGFQKALHRLRACSSDENPRFMYYTFCWAAKHGVFDGSGQATIAHLTGEQLKAYRFVKPSSDEQNAVVEFLDTEIVRLDSLKAEAEYGIELLRERRSALIAAAVTGKIDVRGTVEAQAA